MTGLAPRRGAAPAAKGGDHGRSKAATAACCAGPRDAAGSTTASSTRSATRPASGSTASRRRTCAIYVKCEFFNPAASVKDRLALNIIEAAERDGTLKPGQTVVEATSGNTGIGLAMVCAAKGYPLVVTMADSFSVERRQLMRFLGAKVVLTPRAQKGFGMYMKAKELADDERLVPRPPVRDRRQRRHPREHDGGRRSSPTSRASGSTTSSRGYGTGGTVAGVGRVLKKTWPEREDHPLRAGQRPARRLGHAAAAHRRRRARPASHPAFEPHPIQGWTPDFIPLVLQEAIDGHYYDELIPIAGPEGMKWARELAAKEGILHRRLRRLDLRRRDARSPRRRAPGSVILAMLPDTGERYLSTPLFEPFGADMNEAELRAHALDPGLPARLRPAGAMCGRYMITSSFEAMARLFEAEPRRARPGRRAAAQRLADRAGAGRRQPRRRPDRSCRCAGACCRPSTAPPNGGPLLINARAEGIAAKPAFREAVRERRCLLPADGFYEWQGEKGARVPFVIRPPGGGIIAFAGLWQDWRGPRGIRPAPSSPARRTRCWRRSTSGCRWCIAPEDFALWLGEAGHGAARLMVPAPEEALVAAPADAATRERLRRPDRVAAVL